MTTRIERRPVCTRLFTQIALAAAILFTQVGPAAAGWTGETYFTDQGDSEFGAGASIWAGVNHCTGSCSGGIRVAAGVAATSRATILGKYVSVASAYATAMQPVSGAPYVRFAATGLGATLVDRTYTASQSIEIPIVGAAVSKSFDLAGIGFSVEGRVGGTVGIDDLEPVLDVGVVGISGEPFAVAGADVEGHVDVAVAGISTHGRLDLVDLRIPSWFHVNYAAGWWMGGSSLSLEALKGRVAVMGWLIDRGIYAVFVNEHFPAAFTYETQLFSAAGYL